MRNYQDFNQVFIKRVGVSFQDSQQFKNGHLQEWILNTSNFVLSIMLLNDHLVGLSKFRDVVNDILNEGLIQTNDVFEKGHGAQKHTMVLLLETGQNFWKEFNDILRTFFDDSDGSEDGFLSNVCAIVADTFEHLIVQLSC